MSTRIGKTKHLCTGAWGARPAEPSAPPPPDGVWEDREGDAGGGISLGSLPGRLSPTARTLYSPLERPGRQENVRAPKILLPGGCTRPRSLPLPSSGSRDRQVMLCLRFLALTTFIFNVLCVRHLQASITCVALPLHSVDVPPWLTYTSQLTLGRQRSATYTAQGNRILSTVYWHRWRGCNVGSKEEPCARYSRQSWLSYTPAAKRCMVHDWCTCFSMVHRRAGRLRARF